VDAGYASISSFWPGPTYVDVISLDVYDNTANSTASLSRQGTTVNAYNDLTGRARVFGKPLIFAEVGYSYGAQNISDIWDVKTGDILTASFPQCSLLAVWRSPFGPGSSDSASIKTSLTNMANSTAALTAGEV
jgi:beta-mannanase